MQDRLPAVALTKLERLLATPKLPAEVANAARLLAEEAAVRADEPARGLALTPTLPPPVAPALAFWRASALQALGQFSAALALYQTLPADEAWPYAQQAHFNQASVLLGLSDTEAALKLLLELAKAADPTTRIRAQIWLAETYLTQGNFPAATTTLAAITDAGELALEREFLLGKLCLAQSQAGPAAEHYEAVLHAMTPAGRKLYPSAALGFARAQLALGHPAVATRTLAELIAASPEARYLDLAFAEFRLANRPPDPELEKLLSGWSASPDGALNAPAQHALIESKEAGAHVDEALLLCAEFTTKYPTHPLLAEVLLRQSRMLITQGHADLALQRLAPLQSASQPPQVQAWAAEVVGYAKLRVGDFKSAAQAFKTVTDQTPEPEQKLLAKFQSALATLQASRPEALPDLSQAGLSAALEADLRLERGLYAAAKGAPEADRYLENFLKQHADHPRAFAAALALAESVLPQWHLKNEVMEGHLRTAKTFAKTPADEQRVELLALHFAALSATPEAFAKQADAYLTTHDPGTPQRADLLFKLAERLYNAQQYAPAKARFLQLVAEEPEATEVEAALFFAGKATLGSLAQGCEEQAIKLWDKVAAGKGPLRLQARLEQGKLDQRRDPAAALQIFDAILKAQPPPDASLHHHVLCLRGETLLAQALERPALLPQAMASFAEVLTSPTASTYWKQQAQVRQGDCLLNSKQEPAALEAYTEAMNLTPAATTASAEEADYFWFFRAGEKAMRLLESKQRWKEAVAIAQKLAEAPGPKADAARERANRLITEHFIYQEE